MSTILDLVWLIPVLPLMGFIINGAGRNFLSKTIAGFLGSAVVLASFIISLLVFCQVKQGLSATVHLFNFISIDTFQLGFDFKVDALSSLFLLIITGVGFLIHVYSMAYMHDEPKNDFARYFSFLNLFVFMMLLLVLGNNFVCLSVGKVLGFVLTCLLAIGLKTRSLPMRLIKRLI
ncbi:MAG TPA: hypothetical protein PLN30_04175 [Ferruginibacter sp.]|nr:hypothetical protein [Ferruginibacter sp.]